MEQVLNWTATKFGLIEWVKMFFIQFLYITSAQCLISRAKHVKNTSQILIMIHLLNFLKYFLNINTLIIKFLLNFFDTNILVTLSLIEPF